MIIVSGSSNDVGENNTALSDSTVTALTLLRAEFPNAQIIGLSAVWGDTAPRPTRPDRCPVTHAVEQVGGTFLDIGQPLRGHPELMQADDIHPTAETQPGARTPHDVRQHQRGGGFRSRT
jgi:acyl-CoA thioesterase-1